MHRLGIYVSHIAMKQSSYRFTFSLDWSLSRIYLVLRVFE